jgi:hypothetical protein
LQLEVLAVRHPLSENEPARAFAWPADRLFWAWKSRQRRGHPALTPEIRACSPITSRTCAT